MSDDGERTCPLCAEEMDLTDQQLKPCRCGYEICVWCWHQINNMAEKEEIEGRCPACRTPYDKERIVGMAANCQRVVAEINAEKKQKSQKSKAKTSVEAKKHLSTVRVVQRNLVYIIGLPANLCDETILQRKEYFGQYGKVLKVSISRTTSMPSQQTPSNCTVSVYITYAREEEAIRCIQAVHNFSIEGKTLRACFGTTKYCHAWLKNMSCSNPDCMYLHDVGSQEDSFTKDEIISAYTWSRVPQISFSSQWRSGNILPPPADDFSDNVTTTVKNHVRSVSNTCPNHSIMGSVSQVKGSPSSSSPVKPTVLPVSASWGNRNSNGKHTAANAACSQVPCAEQKVEVVVNSCLPQILTENTKHFSAWDDEVITIPEVSELHISTSKSPSLLIEDKNESSSWEEIVETPKVPKDTETMQINGTTRPVEPFSLFSETARLSDYSSKFSSWDEDVTSKLGEENKLACLDGGSVQPNSPETVNKQSQRSALNVSAVAYIPQLSSNSLVNLPVNTPENKGTFVCVDDDNTVNNTNHKYFDRHLGQSSINRDKVEELKVDQLQVLDSIEFTAEVPPNHDSGSTSRKIFTFFDNHGRNELKDQNSDLLKDKLSPAVNGENGTPLPCDNKMHRVPETSDRSFSHHLNDSCNAGNFSKCISWNTEVGSKQLSSIDWNFNRNLNFKSFVLGDKDCTFFDGHKEHEQSSSSSRQFFECPEMNCNEKNDKQLETVNGIEISDKHATVDMKRESSIISDILSLDVDPWDDSLTTVNDFAGLLGETGRQERPFELFNSLKSKNTNQSRFSFAREENHVNTVNDFARVLDETERQERSFKLFNSLNSKNTNQSRFSFAREENHANTVQPLRDETYTHRVCSSSQGSYENGLLNGIMFNSFQTPTTAINGNLVISSDKVADGTSRAKIPAPPGFTAPSRAPPPGFCSRDRLNQAHEAPLLENRLLGFPRGKHYQMHPAENLNDVEFIDPAILAVGKGRTSPGFTNSGLDLKHTFPSQISPSHIDPKLHLLMRQSLSYQNLGLPGSLGDRFFPLGDAYIPSRSPQNHSSFSPIAQMSVQQLSNTSLMNKQWDGRRR